MPEKGARKWIVTLTIVTGVLLEIIDTTVVNVAMPNIIGALNATLEDAAWIVTGYAIANVIILPISSPQPSPGAGTAPTPPSRARGNARP